MVIRTPFHFFMQTCRTIYLVLKDIKPKPKPKPHITYKRSQHKQTSTEQLLSPCKAALVNAGYGADEATLILSVLFNALGGIYSGKKLGLPTK